jgi:hypothetical protein
LELWPIVEDELFGYELVPDRETHTYVIIGRNALGQPALRTVSYGIGSPNALQLVAVNGRLLSRKERAARYCVQRKDTILADWTSAAKSACAQLHDLFPHRAPERNTVASRPHRHLEDALALAYSHLARWDPSIEFFGLPNEAQLGFPLIGPMGKQGDLTFKEPDMWLLQWHAAPDVVIESWSIAMHELDPSASKKNGEDYFLDRRMHRRRATDRDEPSTWTEEERRQTPGRRATD